MHQWPVWKGGTKKFHSLHNTFFYHFNFLLSGSSTLDPTLVAGRTVLIIKNLAKGNVLENFRPITCLSMVWKFLTSIVRFVLYRHLSTVEAISFHKKGFILSEVRTICLLTSLLWMMPERDIGIFS